VNASDNKLIDLLTAIEQTSSEEDIFRRFLNIAKSLGVETVSYTYAQENENGKTTASFLSNYPQSWVDYYPERKFQNNDYLI